MAGPDSGAGPLGGLVGMCVSVRARRCRRSGVPSRNRVALGVCGQDVLLGADSVLGGVRLGAVVCRPRSRPALAASGCTRVLLGALLGFAGRVSAPSVETCGSASGADSTGGWCPRHFVENSRELFVRLRRFLRWRRRWALLPGAVVVAPPADRARRPAVGTGRRCSPSRALSRYRRALGSSRSC